MGQSAPTVTDAFATFQARYAAFRAELDAAEQRWFDELVCAARRHSSAINRRPHLDFERPVLLAMLMEAMRRVGDAEGRMGDAEERGAALHAETRALAQEVRHALLDAGLGAGLAVRRLPAPDALRHRAVGQARLQDHEAHRPVPA